MIVNIINNANYSSFINCTVTKKYSNVIDIKLIYLIDYFYKYIFVCHYTYDIFKKKVKFECFLVSIHI